MPEPTDLTGHEYDVEFTHMLPSGRACGLAAGRPTVAFGVLPDERAQVKIAAHNHGQLIGEVRELLTTSNHRQTPPETHYTWCSPWQMMEYSYQLQLKQQLITASFAAHGLKLPVPEITPSLHQFGYRTRIEFGIQQAAGSLQLTLHGHGSTVAASRGCLLASNDMNEAALATLQILQAARIDPAAIKSLAIRESKSIGQRLVILYIFPDSFPTLKELPPSATSLIVVQADPSLRMSAPVQVLQSLGVPEISETIASLTITYPFSAFFQNNIPLYEQALGDLQAAIPEGGTITDIYSGVGTIGLSLAEKARNIIAYEVGEEMVQAANKNAENNNISQYQAHAIKDSDLTPAHLTQADAAVVNPTRRGLTGSLVQALRQAQPEYIAYLSCSHQTQARDVGLLQDLYQPTFFKAYDFYPHTPHVETLLILQRK